MIRTMIRAMILTTAEPQRNGGTTLIELLIVVALIAVLTALVLPLFLVQLLEMKRNRAIEELRALAAGAEAFEAELGRFPLGLEELGRDGLRDPWGNPYRYLSSQSQKWKGECRKDQFLVPLNRDFDLYSSGPDGSSRPPLTAKASRDDLVRAADGGYYGAAADF
jgi:general secretion pathway protein G